MMSTEYSSSTVLIEDKHPSNVDNFDSDAEMVLDDQIGNSPIDVVVDLKQPGSDNGKDVEMIEEDLDEDINDMDDEEEILEISEDEELNSIIVDNDEELLDFVEEKEGNTNDEELVSDHDSDIVTLDKIDETSLEESSERIESNNDNEDVAEDGLEFRDKSEEQSGEENHESVEIFSESEEEIETKPEEEQREEEELKEGESEMGDSKREAEEIETKPDEEQVEVEELKEGESETKDAKREVEEKDFEENEAKEQELVVEETEEVVEYNNHDNEEVEKHDIGDTQTVPVDQVISKLKGSLIKQDITVKNLTIPILLETDVSRCFLLKPPNSIPMTKEQLEYFPILYQDESIILTNLDSLFNLIRHTEELKDDFQSDHELVLTNDQLDLSISEDNYYAGEVTLLDLINLKIKYNKKNKIEYTFDNLDNVSLTLRASCQKRFITQFNKLCSEEEEEEKIHTEVDLKDEPREEISDEEDILDEIDEEETRKRPIESDEDVSVNEDTIKKQRS